MSNGQLGRDAAIAAAPASPIMFPVYIGEDRERRNLGSIQRKSVPIKRSLLSEEAIKRDFARTATASEIPMPSGRKFTNPLIMS